MLDIKQTIKCRGRSKQLFLSSYTTLVEINDY